MMNLLKTLETPPTLHDGLFDVGILDGTNNGEENGHDTKTEKRNS